MKKISVIVPVYNVEKYIERCLNSLVKQTIGDIEIIVINDGSLDNSQDIIDKFIGKYPDKIVSLIVPNGGVSKARNIGLERATGEYVGFVDSDDFVDITMYEQLYQKAKNDGADIVVSGYAKLYERTTIDYDLGNMDVFGKSLLESPEMIVKGVPYIWNKIFKRSMIEEHHMRFENFKIFEDLLFTYKNYLYAKKISKVDRALYYYRSLREGSATNTFNKNFFDAFAVMDNFYDCVKSVYNEEALYDYVLYVALNHIVLRWEVPVFSRELDLKKKFYKESLEYLESRFPDYKEHTLYFEEYVDKNPEEYYDPQYWEKRFKEDIKEKLKSKGGLFESIKAKFGNEKKENATITNVGVKYNSYRPMAVDEKIVFIDSQHGNDCNGNTFYLLKAMYFDNRYKDFKFYLNVEEERVYEFSSKLSFYNMTNVNLVKFESEDYLQLLATAKYLFTDTSLPPYYIKKPEQIYFNTWHGTPLKTLGRSSHDEMHRIGNLQKNFRIADYVLYPSQYMKEHMVKDYMLENISHNNIMLAGYPRNSVFFEKANEKIIKEENLGKKQVIAYLPTWRGSLNEVEGIQEIVENLDYIDRHLNANQEFYVNLHPYLKGEVDLGKFKNIKTIPAKYETYDFLNCCDVLITDYSSVFFDFANTKKKIILFAYDKDEYFRDRGVYFDFDELPFTAVNNVADLMDAILADKDYDETEFLKKFCQYDEKDAAKKACEFLVLGEHDIVKTEKMPKNGKKNVMIFVGGMVNNAIMEQWINCLEDLDFDKCNYFLTFRSKKVYRNKLLLRTIPENVKYISQFGDMSITRNDSISLEKYKKSSKFYSKHKKLMDNIFVNERDRAFGSVDIDKIIYYGAKDKEQMGVLSKFDCEKVIYMSKTGIEDKVFNPELVRAYDTVYVKTNRLKNLLLKWTNHPNIVVFDEYLEIFNS